MSALSPKQARLLTLIAAKTANGEDSCCPCSVGLRTAPGAWCSTVEPLVARGLVDRRVEDCCDGRDACYQHWVTPAGARAALEIEVAALSTDRDALIERVAEAIFDAQRHRLDATKWRYVRQDAYRQAARAALAAIEGEGDA